VQEVSCCGAGYGAGETVKSSLPLEVPVWIEPINDAPTVWDASMTPTDPVCYGDCDFDEDFGKASGVIYSPALVYAGGYDIEESELVLEVTSVSCPSATLTTLEGDEVVVGTMFGSLPSGDLTAAFYFKPLADENGSPYCTITYKVIDDGLLESADQYTIVINVDPVNDLPRLVDDQFRTYEDIPLDLSIGAWDVDSVGFDVTFISCTGSGSLYYGTTEICSDIASAPVLSTASSTGSWDLTYVPPADDNGLGFMYVEIEFNDHDPTNPDPLPASGHYFLNIDVLAVNDGPLLSIDGSALLDTVTRTDNIEPGDVLAWTFDMSDKDIDANLMSLVMTTDCGKLSFSPTPAMSDHIFDLLYTGDTLSFQAPLTIMKAAVNTITFSSSDECEAKVSITLGDQGFAGACPPAPDGTPGAHICPLEAVGTITVTVKATGI
jgi:hypothetical protein